MMTFLAGIGGAFLIILALTGLITIIVLAMGGSER